MGGSSQATPRGEAGSGPDAGADRELSPGLYAARGDRPPGCVGGRTQHRHIEATSPTELATL